MNTKSNNNNIGRLTYISWLQFLGPLLVIYGHALNGVAMPIIFNEIKSWVYLFHMPLFFFVSAYLFAYKGGFKNKPGGYCGMILMKAKRLLIPYFCWNLAFILPKWVANALITYDQVDLSVSYFADIFLNPRLMIWGHTWFLFALFEFFALIFVFEFFRKRKKTWIFVTAVLALVNIFWIDTTLLCIGDLMKNAVYFWIGLMLGSMRKGCFVNRAGKNFVVVFLAVIAVITTIILSFNTNYTIINLICGVSVLMLLISIQIKFGINGRTIEYVSKNSFGIYILHWPCMIVTRIICQQILHFPGTAVFCLMIITGIFIPIAIITVLKRIPHINKNKLIHYLFGI